MFGIEAKDDVHIAGELNKGLGLAKNIDIDIKKLKNHEHYFGTAKVGERGQIVIPQDARETFKINSGDLILVFGDIEKGIAFMKATRLKNFAAKLFQAFLGDFEDIQEDDEGGLNEKE
ncbi:MAG: AbrB/MazE/SpoVT family DNA-binding domain-containing protein [Promethearchaeota archaeon]